MTEGDKMLWENIRVPKGDREWQEGGGREACCRIRVMRVGHIEKVDI